MEDICFCKTCLDEKEKDKSFWEKTSFRHIGRCMICGFRFCPHGQDHCYLCRKSNDPNQLRILSKQN